MSFYTLYKGETALASSLEMCIYTCIHCFSAQVFGSFTQSISPFVYRNKKTIKRTNRINKSLGFTPCGAPLTCISSHPNQHLYGTLQYVPPTPTSTLPTVCAQHGAPTPCPWNNGSQRFSSQQHYVCTAAAQQALPGSLPASQQGRTHRTLHYQDPGMHSRDLLLLGHLVQHHPEDRACKAQQVIVSSRLSREKASRFGKHKPSLFLSTVLTFFRSYLHPWTGRENGGDQPFKPRDTVATDKRIT